jgi:putative zinc finger/helix-turn-helix YgiT family protein
MKCASCGAAKLVHDTRDLPYTYKGETSILPQVTGDFCPACDESILDAAESRRTMNLMLAFNRQVNAAIVDPEFIVGVRKKTRPRPARSGRHLRWRRQCVLTLRERQDQTVAGAGEAAQAAGSPSRVAGANSSGVAVVA